MENTNNMPKIKQLFQKLLKLLSNGQIQEAILLTAQAINFCNKNEREMKKIEERIKLWEVMKKV